MDANSTKELAAPFAPPQPYKDQNPLDAVTTSLWDDEPCWSLHELNMLDMSGKNMCRYQLLRIVRDDKKVWAYIYLGPASKFKAIGFDVPGLGLYTVAQMQGFADWIRERVPRRTHEPPDLMGQFREQLEQQTRYKDRLSTFGPGGQLVRA